MPANHPKKATKFVKGIILTESTGRIIKRSIYILNKSDRYKALSLVLIHALLGLLDIFAVLILGLLGSLTVTGVSSNQPGERVKGFLEAINLSENSLQTQVAVLGLISATLLVARSIISLYLSRKVLFFLSRRSAFVTSSLLSKLLRQNLLRINVKNVQELIYALTAGVNAIVSSVLGAAAILAADLFLIFAFTISLFFIDPYIALSSLILFSGVAFILYRIMHGRAQQLGETTTQMTIDSNQKIFEVISSYRELLVKNRRSYYASQISSARLKMANSVAQMAFLNFLSKYVIEISMVVGGLLVATIQFLINPASRAVAVIAIFLVSSTRIAPAVLRIQSGLVGIRNNIGVARPTLDLIEEYVQDYSAEKIIQNSKSQSFTSHDDFLPRVAMDIRTFKYPDSDSANLKDISINIEPGEFIGIVGTSGAGKTTMIDLLLGVLEPTEGEVNISGLPPIEAFDKWPGAVAYVPQETKLINGTLKENVCIGFDSANFKDSDIERLLEQVELSDLILKSNDLHTRIGEGGKGLSGGQKQRLGIARALITNPKLIILDESTSALDVTTERKIMNMLEGYQGLRTIVMVTHRLATIKHANRIVYLEDGEVKGFDSFASLRAKFPVFDQLATAAGI